MKKPDFSELESTIEGPCVRGGKTCNSGDALHRRVWERMEGGGTLAFKASWRWERKRREGDKKSRGRDSRKDAEPPWVLESGEGVDPEGRAGAEVGEKEAEILKV